MTTSAAAPKSADAFRTISEVAESLRLPQHVLRFWETRFVQIKPLKRGGGRRFYRPQDVELLRAIRHLLYGEGYTIKGVQRILREQGPRGVAALAQERMVRSGSAPKPAAEADGCDIAQTMIGSHRPVPGEPDTMTRGDGPRVDGGLSFLGDDAVPEPARGAASPPSAVSPPLQNGPGNVSARLHDVLVELAECRRLLDSAVG